MTTHTPAPAHEAVLTDDEIVAAIAVSANFDESDAAAWRPESLALGRAIESALLSKLRAPVADERRLRRMLCAQYAGALAYMDDGEAQDARAMPVIDFLRDSLDEIERKMRERRPADVLADPALQKLFGEAITGALGFGAQGANPPPKGHWLAPFWEMGRADAALASAPVAGEAVAHAVISYGRIQRLVVNEESAHEYAEQQRLNAEAAGWDAKAHVRPLVYGDAAPQASEADALIDALGQCRDAFPLPDIVGSKLDLLWQEAMSDPSAVPAYIKARAALSAQPSGNPGELAAQPAQKEGGSDA
ncbi:hypothetical protein [Achromobacter denitrificans]|uniref:hypothetical protein n=1 Tax=Achromobacter denitrificans TaxID=32002 RepID=UPI000B4947F4|nr:hypothetical protein [Achromobacter denitrificans]